MTRIKWQQKPYIQSYNTSTNIMKNELVYFSFLYKMRGVLRQPGVYFPLLRYEVLIFTLDVNHSCVIVFTTVQWYWRTLETSGTGLMHNINKCKQTSQWFTNQTEDIIVSYDLTYNIPPMHYTIVLNFHILHICYILLFLISLI